MEVVENIAKVIHPTINEILEEMKPLVVDLSQMITDNVDQTGEKANFVIKCELSTDKDGALHFDITGKTTLSTTPIHKNAAIRDKQLTLFD